MEMHYKLLQTDFLFFFFFFFLYVRDMILQGEQFHEIKSWEYKILR